MSLLESRRLIENPPLCVSRQISACAICRRKKIKCDGLVPVCTPCQRSRRDAECTNGSDTFAQGKERSYVTALESRLAKLERDIAQAKVPPSIDPVHHPPPSSQADPTPKGKRTEEAHVNDLVSDFGFLSVNATSRDFDGLAQEVFAQLILAPSTLLDFPTSHLASLPSRSTLTSLVQYYIDHDLILYPFLSAAKIFGSVEALYEGHAAPADEWTVFLVLAISLASLSTSPEDDKYLEAVRYAGAALRHARMVLLPGSVLAIQMYSMQDPHHLDSWYLIGAAARMMVDLGLHQDPPKSVIKDAQVDLRRRVFHSVYSFDRVTTFVHRRAFSFSDDSASVVLPNLRTNIFSSISEQGHPAMELIRLRQATSVAYQSLFLSGPDALLDPYPAICAAHLEMDKWNDELHQIRMPDESKLSFRCEMLYNKILLLSPFRLERPLEDYGQLLILEHAIGYSHTISSLVRNHIHATICTSYDLLRTIFVVQKFVHVLAEYEDLFFNVDLPLPSYPSISGSAIFPSLHIEDGHKRLRMAVESLHLLDNVLRTLGRRYGTSNAWIDARRAIERIQNTLRARPA
ncbi:MAG: hypothetical protein Q9224_000461 [Gallowayella concinna]